jgi:hypothetical protein
LRKFVAISLVLLLLFNAMGFFGLFVGLRFKTASDLTKRLDSHQYNEDETITVKVPITVPYTLSLDEEYERTDGEVEHQGEFYRLIKQKFENDTLYMVCIKDQESKRIHNALGDYVKTFADKPVDGKQNGKISLNFIKDFLPSKVVISSVTDGWNHTIYFSERIQVVLEGNESLVSPPPRS